MFAWELGGGLGHLARYAPWAAALAARGATLFNVVRDLPSAARGSDRLPGTMLQAPVLLHGPFNRRVEPVCYAEILLHAGYGNAETLGALVQAWRATIDLVGPAIMIADYAPTAMLAARMAGIPVVHVGDGFTIPPAGGFNVAFGVSEDGQASRMARAEEQVTDAVNGALREAGAPTNARLPDLLEADMTILATYAELDHYRGKRDARLSYEGHFDLVSGDSFHWRASGGPRILAYLKPEAGQFGSIVESLARLPVQTSIYAGGLTADARVPAGADVTWSARPLPMQAALPDADLVICHGGHGTVCAALLAGKPLLVLPMNEEQLLTAQNVARLGVGEFVHPALGTKEVRRALNRCLESSARATAAAGFSARHSPWRERSTARLAEQADRMIELAKMAAGA